MSQYTAKYKFSTNVTFAGRLTTIACNQGDSIELDDALAAEVAIQVPGALAPFKAAKPESAPEPEPDVITGEGFVPAAKTRAVVGTKKKAKP